MEKRNRLHRRGQSPPPDGSKVSAARVAASLALATAFVVLLVVVAPLGVLGSLLLGGGLLASLLAVLAALIGLRTALVNYETAKLNLRAAEERAAPPAKGEGSGG